MWSRQASTVTMDGVIRVSEPGCMALSVPKFSMAAQAGGSSDWLSVPSSDSHSFWLDGGHPSALCSVDTSETGWQRQHTKTMYLVFSTVCVGE